MSRVSFLTVCSLVMILSTSSWATGASLGAASEPAAGKEQNADSGSPKAKSASGSLAANGRSRKPNAVINVDEGADLATTIGVGNDVHFARPRTFRTDSFNSEHMEIEPLAVDPSETGATSKH